MPSPMDILLDKVDWKCAKCGQSMKVGCGCHEKIAIKCPKCGTGKPCSKDDSDPKGTALVVATCPDCDADDPGPIQYFDKDGRELFP